MEAVYDRPFWRDAWLTGAVVSDTGLLAFVSGDEGRRWGDDREALKTKVVEQFVTFFGPLAAAPRDVVVQDWSDEVWSRGGPVHLLGPGVLTQDGEGIWAPIGRLHWAGTDTATYWHGYMDGAISSGRRAATEVLAAS